MPLPQSRHAAGPAGHLVLLLGVWLSSGCFLFEPQCVVVARNESAEPVERLVVAGCGVERALGPLAPGEQRQMRVTSYYGHPCALTYSGQQGSSPLAGSLGTYESGERRLTLILRGGGVGVVKDDGAAR